MTDAVGPALPDEEVERELLELCQLAQEVADGADPDPDMAWTFRIDPDGLLFSDLVAGAIHGDTDQVVAEFRRWWRERGWWISQHGVQ